MAFSLGSSAEALGIVLGLEMAFGPHHGNPSGPSLEGACLLLALRVIARRRGNSVALKAQRTFRERRSPNGIYEYASRSLKANSDRNLPADLHHGLGRQAQGEPMSAVVNFIQYKSLR